MHAGAQMSDVSVYLTRCSQVHTFELGATVPPTVDEVRFLMNHLESANIRNGLCGSTAVYTYLTEALADFRPTLDIDVFTSREPGRPPEGWRINREAVGVTSWIAPSGGVVDFLVAGSMLPNGTTVPRNIKVVAYPDSEFRVVALDDLVRLKLNSTRDKDLQDVIRLARSCRSCLSVAKLNEQQRENLQLVQLWLDSKPDN